MSSAKEIQGRIKSIKNIKKITKAMEMVAAVKMRKATDSVLRTRTYANLSWITVLNIAQSVNAGKNLHPLLIKKNGKGPFREAIILMSSNRGLCGGFNSNVIQKAISSTKKHGIKDKKITDNLTREVKKDVDFIVVGKKGLAVKKRYGFNVVADFPRTDVASKVTEVIPVASMVIKDFLEGKYDKVMVAYTDFISVSKQVPRVKQLLPIDLDVEEDHLGIVGQNSRIGLNKEFVKEKEEKYLGDEKENKYIFKFEPSTEEVLNDLLPRLIEVQLFQALLESIASEHSARMTSMHKATEAAEELIDELTLFYNKARQASITSEIAEISAGVNALSN